MWDEIVRILLASGYFIDPQAKALAASSKTSSSSRTSAWKRCVYLAGLAD